MNTGLVVLNSAVRDINGLDGVKLASGSDCAQDALNFSVELRKKLNRIKSEYGAADGHGFDYARLKESSIYSDYLQWIGNLRAICMDTMSQAQRKAFLINIYNSLTIHGIVHQEALPASVIELNSFWSCTAYEIGTHMYSLDDIEHGLLRGNRPHPSTGRVQFTKDDPRLKFVIEEFDCRIHFALNCGAKSCPVVSVYSEDNLDAALESAAYSFCEQETTFVASERTLLTSRLFMWYAQDFGQSADDVIRWITKHLSGNKKEAVQGAVMSASAGSEGVQLAYSNYQWSLNVL